MHRVLVLNSISLVVNSMLLVVELECLRHLLLSPVPIRLLILESKLILITPL